MNIHQPVCPDQSSMRQRRKRLSGLMWLTKGCWHLKKKKKGPRENEWGEQKSCWTKRSGNSLLRLLAVLCAWPSKFTQVYWGEGWNKLNTCFITMVKWWWVCLVYMALLSEHLFLFSISYIRPIQCVRLATSLPAKVKRKEKLPSWTYQWAYAIMLHWFFEWQA